MKTRKDNKLSATDHGVITCNENEIITSWDHHAELIFGWNAKQACGQSLFYLLLPPAPESLPNLTLADVVSTNTNSHSAQFSIKQTVQHKEGWIFEAHLLIFYIKETGSYIVLARDLRAQQNYLDKLNTSFLHQSILETIQKIIAEPLPLSNLIEKIFEYLFTIPSLQLLPKAAAFFSKENGESFTPKVLHGFRDSIRPCKDLPMGMCQCGQAAQFGPLKLIPCTEEMTATGCKFNGPHGHYCCPIKNKNTLLGILCFYTDEHVHYTEEQEELFESIANIIAHLTELKEVDSQHVSHEKKLQDVMAELNEEKKLAQTIINNLPQGVLLTDLQGDILSHNKSAERILKPFADDLNSKSLKTLFGPSVSKKLLKDNTVERQQYKVRFTTSENQQTSILFVIATHKNTQGDTVGKIIFCTVAPDSK